MRKHETKILVIDDEEDYRHLVKVILEPRGYDVVPAADGIEGLKLLKENKPSPALLILDINLPYMDGYQICEAIRKDQEFGLLPILMLTVRRLDEEQIRALNLGADDYLTKPFQPQELIERVQSLLRRSQMN